MIEDERQYEIAEQRRKKSLMYDPDAKVRAEYLVQGKDFAQALASVIIQF